MFKRIVIAWSLLLALGTWSWALEGTVDASLPALPQGSLTLREAQSRALRNSPGIAAAVARIEAAEAVVAQARASLWPQLTLTAGYRLQDSTMQPDWAPEIRRDDSFNNFRAGLQGGWLVFDGFARQARILAARHGVEASEAGLDEVKRLLCTAVNNAFFQAQLAVEKMRIAKSNQEFNRLLEADADKRWRAGAIAEAEKLNFSVRALQAESDYLAAAQNLAVVGTVLVELMALPDARLPEALYPVSALDREIGGAVPEIGTELKYALAHRSDLMALKARLAAAEQRKKTERGKFFPSVFAGGGVQYNDLNGLGTIDQEEHDTYVGINLSWDLFNGGEHLARVRESAAETVRLRAQMESKVLAIRSELQQAAERAAVILAMYRRHEQALEMTQRIRDHIEKAYRAGVTNLTRLNEVQRDLVQVAGLAVYSRINYRIALEDLKLAGGRLPDSAGNP